MLARVRAALAARRPAAAARRRRRGAARLRRRATGSTASSSCARGQGFGRLTGRPLAAWQARLAALGFAVDERADARRHAVRERPARRHGRACAGRTGREPMTPARLDHAGIEALIPHRGPMCLLDRMTSWDATRIECVAVNHRDPRHPLAQRERPAGERGDRVRGAGDGAARRALRRRRRRPRRPGLPRQRARRPPRLPAPRRPAGRRARRARRRRRAPGGATPARLLYAFVLRHDGRELASGASPSSSTPPWRRRDDVAGPVAQARPRHRRQRRHRPGDRRAARRATART